MNYKVFLGLCVVALLFLGCEVKTEMPEGRYQATSYNTGKKVIFDFKENGTVYVQTSHVKVSERMVDDTFFPFFKDGENLYQWTMTKQGHLVSIYSAGDFEIVRLEYNGKYLSWDKTKFTKE